MLWHLSLDQDDGYKKQLLFAIYLGVRWINTHFKCCLRPDAIFRSMPWVQHSRIGHTPSLSRGPSCIVELCDWSRHQRCERRSCNGEILYKSTSKSHKNSLDHRSSSSTLLPYFHICFHNDDDAILSSDADACQFRRSWRQHSGLGYHHEMSRPVLPEGTSYNLN